MWDRQDRQFCKSVGKATREMGSIVRMDVVGRLGCSKKYLRNKTFGTLMIRSIISITETLGAYIEVPSCWEHASLVKSIHAICIQ